MERQRLNSLIQQPDSLQQVDIAELEALRDKYPWFSSAHLLLALGELNDEQIVVSEKLSRTAIAVPDRTALFEASKRKSAPVQDIPITTLEIVPDTVVVNDDTTPELPAQKENDPLEALIQTEAIKSSVSIELLEAGLKETASQQVHKEEKKPNPEKPRKSFSGKMNFLSWLEPAPDLSAAAGAKDPEEQLEQFLEERKKKAKEKAEFFSPSRMAKRSLEDHDGLVTETLAKIHVMQENWGKAIDTYRRLSTKYPEKASYYEGLIKELEEQLDKG